MSLGLVAIVTVFSHHAVGVKPVVRVTRGNAVTVGRDAIKKTTMGGAVTQPSESPTTSLTYVLKTSGNCDIQIKSITECSSAAQSLGLSGTAIDDGNDQSQQPHDPPFCYFEGNSLKYNSAGNRGNCSSEDQCICRQAHVLKTSGKCEVPVESISECSLAAQSLGVTDTAIDDGNVQSQQPHDPPFCYFEGNSLKYNSAGNRGNCSSEDQCICRQAFVLETSGDCEVPVRSITECSNAAQSLGFSVTTAIEDGNHETQRRFDPPYCYFEEDVLKYSNGSNHGSCTSEDQCICHRFPSLFDTGSPTYSPTPSPTPLLTESPTTSLTYVLKTSGNCDVQIKSITECSIAAQSLGLSGTAIDDSNVQSQEPHDPPFCYFEGKSLKYNSGGNRGNCSSEDQCICRQAHVLKTSGKCDVPVESISECSLAAQSLGLSDTAIDDSNVQSQEPHDPPFCYFEGNSLKYNSAGNRGNCSSEDQCICRQAFVLETSGDCEVPVKSITQCSYAAESLGLSATTAIEDGNHETQRRFDPPYCYFEENVLKYNGGSNHGSCTAGDQCICHRFPSLFDTGSLTHSPTPSPTPSPTSPPTLKPTTPGAECGVFRKNYKCDDVSGVKPAGETNVTTETDCSRHCQQYAQPGACCQFNVNNNKCRFWSDTELKPDVDDAGNENKMAFKICASGRA